MGKLTKAELKRHDQTLELLWGSDAPLSQKQVRFVLKHYDPRATHLVNKGQIYFTPLKLAVETTLYTNNQGELLDLCAGIGHLTYAILTRNFWSLHGIQRLIAVEINPEFVRIGQRLFPQVEWHCADAFDLSLWQTLGRFDKVVANPPFGHLPTTCDDSWLTYRGPAGLRMAEIALRVARQGVVLILPQSHTPYQLSGQAGSRCLRPAAYGRDLRRFTETFPQVEFEPSSLDCTPYQHQWRGASPTVEIVRLSCQRDAPLSLPAPLSPRALIHTLF